MNRTAIRRSLFAFSAAALFLAACVTLAAPVGAQGANRSEPRWGEARSVRIDASDLDLATEEGRARLEHRVAAAVDRVCALPNGDQLSQRARVGACKAQARDAASERLAQLIEAVRPLARTR